MALDPELADLMNQTISVANETGRNLGGDPTFGAAAEVFAYVEEFVKVVHDATGEERTTSHRIFTADTDTILITDGIWLPGDDDSDATLRRRPISAHPAIDEDGNVDHYRTLV